MRIIKHLKVGIILFLLFISVSVFAQPPFTPPGQGGGPPPRPCPGPPWQPCPDIPISGGIEFLIAAGMVIGLKKLYSSNKTKHK